MARYPPRNVPIEKDFHGKLCCIKRSVLPIRPVMVRNKTAPRIPAISLRMAITSTGNTFSCMMGFTRRTPMAVNAIAKRP